MPKVWSDADYQKATSLVGQVQDPSVKAQLQAKIKEYEQGKFSGSPTGLAAIEQQRGEAPMSREARDFDPEAEARAKAVKGEFTKTTPRERSPGDATLPTPWHEPSLERFKMEMTPVYGGAVEDLDENSDLYKEYANRLWNKAVEQAEAQGESLTRVSQMPTGSVGEKAARLGAQGLGVAESLLTGIDEMAAAGLGTKLAGAFDPEAEAKAAEAQERSPVASGIGNVAGVLSPFSPAALAGSAAIKFAGPRLAALAAKYGGGAIPRWGAKLGTAAVGGGTGLAAEGAAQELVPQMLDLDEQAQAFAQGQVNPYDPLGFLARRAEDFGIGAVGGAVAEPVGALAGKAVKRLRSGPRGQELAALEKEGLVSTKLGRGVTFDEPMQELTRQAEMAGIKPTEQAVRNVREPLTTQAARQKADVELRHGDVNRRYYQSPEGQQGIPLARFQAELANEIAAMKSRSGAPLSGADRGLIRTLERMLGDVTIPGSAQVKWHNAEELDRIIDNLDEMGAGFMKERKTVSDSVIQRLKKAIRQDRDQFPENDVTRELTGGRPRRVGNPLKSSVEEVEGWSAAKNAMADEIAGMERQVGGAGFPTKVGQDFGPGAEGQKAWDQLGRIPGAQGQASAAMTSPEADVRDAVRNLARNAGIEREINMVRAAQFKEAMGDKDLYGRLYAIGGRPASLLSLNVRRVAEHTDPIMRAAAKKLQAMPMTPELESALYQNRGKYNVNPFAPFGVGAPGGIVAAPGMDKAGGTRPMTDGEAEQLLQLILESQPKEEAPAETPPQEAPPEGYEVAPEGESDDEFEVDDSQPTQPIGFLGDAVETISNLIGEKSPPPADYKQDPEFMAMLEKLGPAMRQKGASEEAVADQRAGYIRMYKTWRAQADEAKERGDLSPDLSLRATPRYETLGFHPQRARFVEDERGNVTWTDETPAQVATSKQVGELADESDMRMSVLKPEQREAFDKRLPKNADTNAIIDAAAKQVGMGERMPSPGLVYESLQSLGYNISLREVKARLLRRQEREI